MSHPAFTVYINLGANVRESILLSKPQVSVTVTQGVSVVGVAGWPVMLMGWPAGR